MWRIALLSVVMVGSLSAQMIGIGMNRLSPGLVSYLELTQSQQEQIVRANAEFGAFNLQKGRRSAQVQAEIQAELRKPDPDPMALGLRYRELEAIRRETAAEQDRTLQAVQGLLTAAQKQKLATLQEALRIQSTACEAVNWNLITPPPPVPGLLGQISPASMCGTPAFRTGDFNFLPGMP